MINNNLLVIRDYTSADIEIIAQKQEELINFHFKIDPSYYKPSINAQEEIKEFLKRKLNDKNFKLLLVLYHKEVIGYVMGWMTERPPIYFYRKVGYLSNIYIDDKYRGLGIGSKIFKVLEKWFIEKKATFIEIKADSENEDTIKSFIAFGFSMKIRGFYKKIETNITQIFND